MRSTLYVFALVLACGCSRESPSTNGSAPQQARSITLASATEPSATVFPSNTPPQTNAPSSEEDAVHRQLRTAPISALTIVSWSKPGLFRATLDRPHSEGPAQVTLTLALDQHPITHRRSLAFAQLAHALEMHVVPPTVVRRVSTGELGTLFANDADARAYLSAHASVQNDGTIAALIVAPSRGDALTAWKQISRREIVLDEAPEARFWARAVASEKPLPDENKVVLRDYVEALVLDYLSANIMRRSLLLDDAASELFATDNGGAFPSKDFANAEARLLERLKPVVRFPHALRDALTKFDRVHARKFFLSGTFDTWLLSPRTLMLIDERRATLLTLLAARIGGYGEQVALSL